MGLARRIRRIAAGATILLVAIAVLLGVYYAPLSYRESDGQPVAFMSAAVRLELTDAEIVAVTPDSRILMQKCCPRPLDQPLMSFMEKRGWTYLEQMGAGIIYIRDGIRIIATSRRFSRRYIVYRLEQSP